MTKEEFGINLFETIKTIGGILGIDQQRANENKKDLRRPKQKVLLTSTNMRVWWKRQT